MSKTELVYQNQPATEEEIAGGPEELNYEQLIELALRKKLVRICKHRIHMEPLNLTATLQGERIKVDDFSPLDLLELAEDISRRYPYGLVFVDLKRNTYVLNGGTYYFRHDKTYTSVTEKLDHEDWFNQYFL